MIISPSELRRTVDYDALKAVAFSPSDPDSVNFNIGTDVEEELAEVECLSSGLKSVYYWRKPGERIAVSFDSAEFQDWSDGLRRKVAEGLVELAIWETALRRLGGAWNAMEPANFAPIPPR